MFGHIFKSYVRYIMHLRWNMLHSSSRWRFNFSLHSRCYRYTNVKRAKKKTKNKMKKIWRNCECIGNWVTGLSSDFNELVARECAQCSPINVHTVKSKWIIALNRFKTLYLDIITIMLSVEYVDDYGCPYDNCKL